MNKLIFTSLIFVLFYFQIQSQNNCDTNSDKYYTVNKKISKRSFKRQSISGEDKSALKLELAEQISTRISVMSVSKSENVIINETGGYNSFENTEAYRSASGVINNPEFIYCKIGRKYYVYCRVKKVDFDTDLYNSLKSKVKVFQQLVSGLGSSVNMLSEAYNNSVERLKKDYYYIINGIDFVSRSPFITGVNKEVLINQVSIALAGYKSLENLLLANFERAVLKLERFLKNRQYEEINIEFPNWTIDKLNSIQRQKFVKFKIAYEKSIESYIKNLRIDLKKAIRNRNETKVNELLDSYSKITFYKDNQKRYEQFKNKLANRLGPAMTNLFIGLNGGTSFQNLNTENDLILLEQVGRKMNFNQILPSINFGLKHYFSNPQKRLGISLSYKSFSDKYINSGDETSENPIKNFSSIQAGIILGPLEFNYGPVKSSLDIEKLSLMSLKLGVLRSDKLFGKFSKSNYLEIFVFGDYLSDFGEYTFLQAGIGVNFNLAFNRTAKY